MTAEAILQRMAFIFYAWEEKLNTAKMYKSATQR